MATVKEIVDKMKDVEKVLSGYLSYDADVDGLVSSDIKDMSEARKLLEDPTKEKITQALKTIQSVKEDIDPYATYAMARPITDQIKSVLEALKTL